MGTTHVVLSTGEAIMGHESTGLNMRLVIRALLTEVAHSFSGFDTQAGMELTTGASIRLGPQWNIAGRRLSRRRRLQREIPLAITFEFSLGLHVDAHALV